MTEMELEPDRNRLHDLVRLVWQSARESSAGDGTPVADGTRNTVTDQEIADAGPYSVQQVRDHLTAEQEGLYQLERSGDTVVVVAVQDG
jgi:hypothetical protein